MVEVSDKIRVVVTFFVIEYLVVVAFGKVVKLV